MILRWLSQKVTHIHNIWWWLLRKRPAIIISERDSFRSNRTSNSAEWKVGTEQKWEYCKEVCWLLNLYQISWNAHEGNKLGRYADKNMDRDTGKTVIFLGKSGMNLAAIEKGKTQNSGSIWTKRVEDLRLAIMKEDNSVPKAFNIPGCGEYNLSKTCWCSYSIRSTDGTETERTSGESTLEGKVSR